MKQITYTRSALKALRRMPASTAKLIMAMVEQYAADPASLTNNVTALAGRDGIHLRVGDWRVIMDEDGVVLAVLEIGPRRHLQVTETVMNEMVTITRAEYDRLRHAAEDLGDLRAYDRARAALASGADELVPAEFATRLIAGETPLRLYRNLRGLTQMQLADMSGVNRVQVADIEAGRKTGSVDTLRKLADALGVTVDDLI